MLTICGCQLYLHIYVHTAHDYGSAQHCTCRKAIEFHWKSQTASSGGSEINDASIHSSGDPWNLQPGAVGAGKNTAITYGATAT